MLRINACTSISWALATVTMIDINGLLLNRVVIALYVQSIIHTVIARILLIHSLTSPRVDGFPFVTNANTRSSLVGTFWLLSTSWVLFDIDWILVSHWAECLQLRVHWQWHIAIYDHPWRIVVVLKDLMVDQQRLQIVLLIFLSHSGWILLDWRVLERELWTDQVTSIVVLGDVLISQLLIGGPKLEVKILVVLHHLT